MGESQVTITGLDEMAVGLTNEDARHVSRVIFYGHFSATPDIARKGVGPIADFLQVNSILE